MRLKLFMMVASAGLIGAAISGCVSEGGHYRSDYRPAYQSHTRHVDHRSDRDRFRDARRDRDHSSHRSNDRDRHSDRDRASGHNRDCRPGAKDCRRPHR